MQTTHTSVLARRVRISSDFHTIPYEAGWATEAVVFVQAEGEHPPLTASTEISPDGITWVRRGEPRVLGADDAVVDLPLVAFGNWLRIAITGATESSQARVLVHVSLKG
ncbi:DUF6385 domain-containing protein [Jiangella sp. DSM 45060]|uniref:DUF6385 domain-containing protein n=1 Tax=Jiangella sp. DSM 45060 TaxID=1798224 RepID=UPI00087BBCDF|nr:DUF6385 domain-containing protein [Jiangella sp. DSM 45060]SDS49200.1 hypothetical protein SAMN04515669_1217 [Jiangella sp. DSM 45060]